MPNIFPLFDNAETSSKDKGEGGDARLRYGVNECSDELTATALVRAYAPLAVAAGSETLIRQAIRSKVIGVDFWEFEIGYGPESDKDSQEPPQPGTWKFEFDTSGARQKITSAPLVSRHWGSDFGEAPDLQGAINWDGKTVHGVEIPVANAKFSIVQYFEARDVTPALFRTYYRATPRVNSDTWLGFDPGEVIYLGSKAQGDVPTVAGQRVQPIGVRHEYESSANRTDVSVSDGPGSGNIISDGRYGPAAFDAQGNSLNGQPAPQVNVKGWEYMWILFGKRVDEDESKVVPRPKGVYVQAPFTTMAFGSFFGFGSGG